MATKILSMPTQDSLTLLFALVGGIIPPLIWLWFWDKEEDGKNPEPKSLVVATFIGGMIAVPIAFFLEKKISDLGLGEFLYATAPQGKLFAGLIILVFIEEVVKYFAAQGIAFPNKHFDEPVDAIIYMISAALGFAALENSLFLIEALSHVNITLNQWNILFIPRVDELLVNNNLRFIGANVLHTVSSGLIGVFIGYSFYKHWTVKIIYFFMGLSIATLLHTFFNFFIITNGDKPIVVFSFLWAGAILLIFLFERVKRIRS